MKILYLTNIPSPYRVDYFNELGKYCDLTVLFEIQSSTERDKSWKSYKAENFKGIVMGGIRTRFDAAYCFDCIIFSDGDFGGVMAKNASYTISL